MRMLVAFMFMLLVCPAFAEMPLTSEIHGCRELKTEEINLLQYPHSLYAVDELLGAKEVRVCDVCGDTEIVENWKLRVSSRKKMSFYFASSKMKWCEKCLAKAQILIANMVNQCEKGWVPVMQIYFDEPERGTNFVRKLQVEHPPIMKKCKECGHDVEVTE